TPIARRIDFMAVTSQHRLQQIAEDAFVVYDEDRCHIGAGPPFYFPLPLSGGDDGTAQEFPGVSSSPPTNLVSTGGSGKSGTERTAGAFLHCKLCGVNLQYRPRSLNRRCVIATGAQWLWWAHLLLAGRGGARRDKEASKQPGPE